MIVNCQQTYDKRKLDAVKISQPDNVYWEEYYIHGYKF